MSRGKKHVVCMSDLRLETCDKFSDVIKLTKKFASRPKKLRSWVFRGQSDASWHLETKLEQQLNEFDLPLKDAPEIERGLLRKFRRHCENYISNVTEWWNYMEWSIGRLPPALSRDGVPLPGVKTKPARKQSNRQTLNS